MSGKQRNMENLKSRGQQLVEATNKLPQFDSMVLQADIDTTNQQWDTTTKVEIIMC